MKRKRILAAVLSLSLLGGQAVPGLYVDTMAKAKLYKKVISIKEQRSDIIKVPKSFGKIVKYKVKYPDSASKGKVKIAKNKNNLKVTGLSEGKVIVTVTYKNGVKYVYTYNIKPAVKNPVTEAVETQTPATPESTSTVSQSPEPASTAVAVESSEPVINLIPISTPAVAESLQPTVAPVSTPRVSESPKPSEAPTSTPVVSERPTQTPAITLVPTSTPVVSESPEPTETAVPSSTPVATKTPAPTQTPLAGETNSPSSAGSVEHVDVSQLIPLDVTCNSVSVNKFFYTNVSLDLRKDSTGLIDYLFVVANTITNITNEQLKPDCHIKFYDANGDFVCETQGSWDTGSNWNVLLKKNESYSWYMCSVVPGSATMPISKQDFNGRVKYWRLSDIV